MFSLGYSNIVLSLIYLIFLAYYLMNSNIIGSVVVILLCLFDGYVLMNESKKPHSIYKNKQIFQKSYIVWIIKLFIIIQGLTLYLFLHSSVLEEGSVKTLTYSVLPTKYFEESSVLNFRENFKENTKKFTDLMNIQQLLPGSKLKSKPPPADSPTDSPADHSSSSLPSSSQKILSGVSPALLSLGIASDFPDLKYRSPEEVRYKYPLIFQELKSNNLSRNPLPFLSGYKNPCLDLYGSRHCLPYAIILGQPKCGTSDLFERIKAHPDVK